MKNIITSKTSIAETLPFMSQEMLEGPKILYSTDIWSLGVIIYLLIEGKFPFPGQNYHQIISSTCFTKVD